MAETEMYTGIVTALLNKYADPILKGVAGFARDGWEKFKVDFDVAFCKYLKNAVEKYGKIKTILYRTEPKSINDFFECPNLHKERACMICGNSIDNLFDISNFIIIQGSGGIGKSTFLKYLFVQEVSKKRLIPVFIELKDLNSMNEDYEICDFIFQRLYDLGSTIKKEYMDYALQSGCFVFLLDGYDEVSTLKRDTFFRKLDRFCDRNSNNYFIISSRPYSEFVEFQRFSVLRLCNLSKEQALSLVRKLEFDKEIKSRFLAALDAGLFERHRSFASNPLLLNIMLLTFDNYAEIPEKLHLFYSNAFETLYSKHDATKAGYRREMRSSLSYDSFRKVFAYFCFVTYYQSKYEMTHEELLSFLKKVSKSINTVDFDAENYILDLVNSICVLYKEGVSYKFTHRSFQEYFTAIFLRDLSDQSMKKMGLELIRKDYYRASHDSVFSMLRDMAEQRFEQNILLPYIIEFDASIGVNDSTDKYDLYFQSMSPQIEFEVFDDKNEIQLLMYDDFRENAIGFIYHMARYYRRPRGKTYKKQTRQADDMLKDFLIEKRDYRVGEQLEAINFMSDPEVYSLIKASWLGEWISTMLELKNILESRKKEEEVDLTGLLLE